MTFDSTYFFLSLASVGNIVLVVLNGIVFVALLQRLRRARHKEATFAQDSQQLLKQAHEQANQVLISASKQAQELLAATNFAVTDMQQQLRATFQEFMAQKTADFNKDLERVNTDYTSFLSQLSQTLKGDSSKLVESVMGQAKTEIEGFVSRLKEDTAQASNRFETQLRQEFTKAMDQVKGYREEQLGLVEKTINQIILKVSKLVLPEAISVADHERLIMESLEQAKKENVLESALKS